MKKTLYYPLYIGISSFVGLVLILLGIFYKETNAAVYEDDALFMNMVLTIPGILLILNSFFCLGYEHYYKNVIFLVHSFLLFFISCLLVECVYFQLIYFGLKQPQQRMIIPALIITLIYSLLSLFGKCAFLLLRKALRK